MDQVNLSNPAGAGISLITAAGTFTFNSLDVQGSGSFGVNIQSSGGTFTFTDLAIAGGSDDAFRVNGGSPTVDVNVSAGGISNVAAFKRVLVIQSTTGGTVTFNGGSITDAGGSGIDIFSAAGAITVNTPVTIDNPSGSGVDIIGGTAPVTFADVTMPPPALAMAAAGAPVFQPVQDPVLARLGGPTGGVAIDNPTGTITFGTLDITTGNVPALAISGAGTVRVTDPSSRLESLLSSAIDVFSVDLEMTFASVISSSFSSVGIRLNGTTGDLTMSGGSITSTLGSSIRITGGSTNMSYAGSITSTRSSDVVFVQNTTGGTMTFSGPITELCDTCSVSVNAGINLLNNTGATINFSGDLTLGTGPNTGFSATGGGTVNVTGTNTVSTTIGIGINIQNTDIGGSGFTFQSVSVSGATNGIVLNNTGSGDFAVTGTGAAGSGGSILNTTGRGIDISGGGGTFTFTSLDINNSTTAGISLNSTSGTFTLQNSNVTNSGNFADAGVQLIDHVGSATISNSTVDGSTQNNVNVQNDVGPLALTITGSTFSNSSSKGGIGVDIQTGTNASVTATVTGTTFDTNSLGLSGFSTASSTLALTVQGGNSFTSNGDGISLDNSGGGTLTFQVMGNGFTGNSFNAVDLRSTSSGLMSGSITGNTISGGPLFSTGIDMFFNGGADAIVRTSGNNINGGSFGVQALLGSSLSDNSKLDLTVETEIISLNLSSIDPGINVTGDQLTTLCTNIRSNTITVGDSESIHLHQEGSSTVSVEGLNGGMGMVSLASPPTWRISSSR